MANICIRRCLRSATRIATESAYNSQQVRARVEESSEQ